MTAVWASPQLNPAGVLIHFILGLVAAFNLSARCRSCCKLAENCLHTGRTVCNPFPRKRALPQKHTARFSVPSVAKVFLRTIRSQPRKPGNSEPGQAIDTEMPSSHVTSCPIGSKMLLPELWLDHHRLLHLELSPGVLSHFPLVLRKRRGIFSLGSRLGAAEGLPGAAYPQPQGGPDPR